MDNSKHKIQVLYFGSYDPDYARNHVLINGLKQNDIEIMECRDDSAGLKKYYNLYQKHKQFRGRYDVMVVGFLGQILMPLAKILSSKKIILDAFVSLYEANIIDREIIKPRSLAAYYYWFLDWLSFKLADVILFDTQEHINYVSEEFNINRGKFERILVGAEENYFTPELNQEKRGSRDFTVLFYGSFIPLQGVEIILKAAKILEKEKIIFKIIGDGQEKNKMLILTRNLNLKNVEFIGRQTLEGLKSAMSESDICLGIFGNSPKTQRVIPNKVYGAVAMAKPVITADTPAIRELFDENDIFLIKPNNPAALADAIIKLKNDPQLTAKLAENGRLKYEKSAATKILGGQFKEIIIKLLKE